MSSISSLCGVDFVSNGGKELDRVGLSRIGNFGFGNKSLV